MRMLRNLCCVSLFALVACTGGDDDGGGSQFDGECDASAATCGQISVRWSIKRPNNQGGDAMCNEVSGTNVRVTTTFQPDGRIATYTSACTSGATLTPRLPLGPYSLKIELLDAANTVLDDKTTNATIGVAGTVTETAIAFQVLAGARPGKVFGACSASQPCTDGSQCTSFGSVQMCLYKCTDPQAGTSCKGAGEKVGETYNLGCLFNADPAQAACFLTCSGAGSPCPGDLQCRDLGGYIHWVCTP